MNTVPIKQKCITNSPGANGYTTITSANIEIDATLCRVHTCHLQRYYVKAHHLSLTKKTGTYTFYLAGNKTWKRRHAHGSCKEGEEPPPADQTD